MEQVQAINLAFKGTIILLLVYLCFFYFPKLDSLLSVSYMYCEDRGYTRICFYNLNRSCLRPYSLNGMIINCSPVVCVQENLTYPLLP